MRMFNSPPPHQLLIGLKFGTAAVDVRPVSRQQEKRRSYLGPMTLLARFYSAFAQHDWATMGACYHPEAQFSDPVFPHLDAAHVRAMWKMLLISGTDLRVEFRVIEETATEGRVEWDAWYTFGATVRKVHNRVSSTLVLKDGLILVQKDSFNFWCWSRQALGISGLLLGWSSMLRGKVRGMAAKRLAKAMGG